MKPSLETPLEAARRLGLDRVCKDAARAVRMMARRGQLVAVQVGKFTMIDPRSVDAYIAGTK